MPSFDETGPSGLTPPAGEGPGYCVLKYPDDPQSEIEGCIGIQRQQLMQKTNRRKEVNDMPRGDGTGPAGMGSMTGRAAGFCAGYGVPGYANPIGGRGFGRGLGLGFRGGRRFYPYPAYGYAPYTAPAAAEATPQEEIEALQAQAKSLENTLKQIHKRIDALESGKSEE